MGPPHHTCGPSPQGSLQLCISPVPRIYFPLTRISRIPRGQGGTTHPNWMFCAARPDIDDILAKGATVIFFQTGHMTQDLTNHEPTTSQPSVVPEKKERKGSVSALACDCGAGGFQAGNTRAVRVQIGIAGALWQCLLTSFHSLTMLICVGFRFVCKSSFLAH